jgi:hypothetical protein
MVDFHGLYQSPLQQLVVPAGVPALFLGFWLAAERGRRESSPARRFARLYCPLFALESVLDPLATGLLPPALSLGPAAGAALAFAFVLLGDFRVLWLVLSLLDREPAPRAAARQAALLSLAAPAADGVGLALGVGGQGLWLVHEVAFLSLVLWLRQILIPRRAPAERRPALRAAAGYAAATYALWALSDALLLGAGLDLAWLLRILPNQLYYAFWIPFVYAVFLSRR